MAKDTLFHLTKFEFKMLYKIAFGNLVSYCGLAREIKGIIVKR